MTVLDAYAVIAYLRDEPAAAEVGALLSGGGCVATAVGVAEILDQLIRIVGADEEEAALDLAQLGLLDGVPVDGALGAAAGGLRARHYHRTGCAISLADCVAAEVTRARDEVLATSDPHLLDVCRRDNIRFLVLPDSNNERWHPPSP